MCENMVGTVIQNNRFSFRFLPSHFRRREYFATAPLDENAKNIFREERAEKYTTPAERERGKP